MPEVNVDRDLIQRVIANLIDNAIKFTPKNGKILISAEAKNGSVLISIADNGPGIPPEYRKKIFERFGQVPDQRSRRRGSGLGLTFCRLAIEAHQGRIWVDDNPVPPGAVLTFTLPTN
jgi:signal transduction histidine kinase